MMLNGRSGRLPPIPFAKPLQLTTNQIQKVSQQTLKSDRTRRILLHRSGVTNSAQRRARTRSLIQLGGLIEKAGLLETFGIELGLDLQKDLTMKEPIAALFKGLLDLNDSSQTDHAHFSLWAQEGLHELSASSQKFDKEI